jgi:tetratricopeptide (TPR) repeat protein
MQAGLEETIAQENWRHAAAASACNLSELYLTLGEVPRAVALGEKSVELADRSGVYRVMSRATWAAALHQADLWEESAATFREAEALQVELLADPPRLTSLQGFQYCDLLLGYAEPEAGTGLDGLVGLGLRPEEAERFWQACREVLERGRGALRVAEEKRWPLDIALDHLTLGRAHLVMALTEASTVGLAQATEHLNRAVDSLRQSGQEDYLPRGLLARAALRRFRSDFSGAAADLTEALEIAERGPMRLHECNAHLEWARLCRDQGDLAAARLHVARARELVNETGYGRREREVGWLEGAIGKG